MRERQATTWGSGPSCQGLTGTGARVGETPGASQRCPDVSMQIVAHRGAAAHAPENTLEAFRAAQQLGADAVELDVRLSADDIAIVYHYAYLEALTDGRGPVWQHSLATTPLGLEIELKGPEPETVDATGGLLDAVRAAWQRIEVTSYQPALLHALSRRTRGLRTALLVPRSEAWMGLDVVAHHALHGARQASANAVHLHPSQLSEDVVRCIRSGGIEVHAWDVNASADLALAATFEVPIICTDHLEQALHWRTGL